MTALITRAEKRARDATEVLNRPAIEFDTDRRYDNQKAWPFFYPFVPKPYLDTDVLNNGKGLLGIKIAAGETKDINIQLDRDAVYRLINIKYSPYTCREGYPIEAPGAFINTTAGSNILTGIGTTFTTTLYKGLLIAWQDNGEMVQCAVVKSVTNNLIAVLEEPAHTTTVGSVLSGGIYQWYGDIGSSIQPSNLFVYRPLTNWLRATVVMTSLRGRYLYGGSQEFITGDVAKQGLQERPHLISALQGIDDGLGQLRTSMIFAYASTVKIRVTNLYYQEILLNGTLFGYKISVGGDDD